MNKENISLTGKFLYTNPRATLTQTPPVIRNKNDIETIKELQQINFKLQQENKQLKDNWNRLKEYCETHYYGITSIGILNKMQEIESSDNNE